MAPSLPTSNYDRINFGIMAAGFSLALLLKFGAALFTRKLRGTDSLASIIMGIWLTYISIQLVDMWAKRTAGPIQDYQWVVSTATVLYSTTLCAVLHLSFIRCAALAGFSQINKKRFEYLGLFAVAVVFVMRVVRTGYIFSQTAQSTPNPSLSQTSTLLQTLTLLPTLFLRLLLDTWSLVNLYRSRVKYVEQAGKEAFNIITSSLCIEFVFSVFASIVACQEAANFTGDKLAFMDWLLFSWCLASWVEQRPLYMAIFGAKLTTGSQSEVNTNHTELSSMSKGGRDVEYGSHAGLNSVKPQSMQYGSDSQYGKQKREEW
ncbi:hypothetical protein HDU97_003736 [Phlyctochytrium planicorne]|nr:hypothetical protein HDU97_003736 [Phlyctochytrium planicorne]